LEKVQRYEAADILVSSGTQNNLNMALTYQVPHSVIDAVLVKMKASLLIHPEASFNSGAEQGLRKEVAYRDLDFLARISGKEYEELIVDSAMDYLKRRGFVDPTANYDKELFSEFRRYVNERFTHGSWTTISPVMERMYYMLASVKRPKTMIELGCFWGNSLAWFAGPCLGPKPSYEPDKIYAIDIDQNAIRMARGNFSSIAKPSCLEIICEDAREALDRFEGPFDFVYIDVKTKRDDSPLNTVYADAKSTGEGELYLPLLRQIYDKLPKGAWVMAHDATWFKRQDDLKDYLCFVRDKRFFSESIVFDIDLFGMELTIK
jgi:protein-L-isoaspartate O-methyltransferase